MTTTNIVIENNYITQQIGRKDQIFHRLYIKYTNTSDATILIKIRPPAN